MTRPRPPGPTPTGKAGTQGQLLTKAPEAASPPVEELVEVELRLCFYWPRPMAQPPKTKTCSLEARGFRKPEPGPLAGSPSGSRGDRNT